MRSPKFKLVHESDTINGDLCAPADGKKNPFSIQSDSHNNFDIHLGPSKTDLPSPFLPSTNAIPIPWQATSARKTCPDPYKYKIRNQRCMSESRLFHGISIGYALVTDGIDAEIANVFS